MQELLNHPAVQAGIAPFVAALITAFALRPVRLSGLAVLAGFAAAVYLIAGFEFTPLSTTRKLLLVGLLAPVVGVAIDRIGKPGRGLLWGAAIAGGAVSVWVFIAVLRQKAGVAPWLLGGGGALLVAWLAGSMLAVRDDTARTGATTLALGLGVGVSAILGASASFGFYGIALAACGGAVLLALLASPRGLPTGAALALPAALIAGLLATGTMVLASLPWASMAALALVPVAVRLPHPAAASTWMKAALFSVYACVPAVLACALAWQATVGTPS